MSYRGKDLVLRVLVGSLVLLVLSCCEPLILCIEGPTDATLNFYAGDCLKRVTS